VRSLLRFVVIRRLARFMPGGWVAWVLASPTAWRLLRRAWRAVQEGRERRRGGGGGGGLGGGPGPPPAYTG
jgi:hypothetical protein